MIRACGFAIGLFIALWGGVFLCVDKLVLFEAPKTDSGIRGMLIANSIEGETRPVVDPADWVSFLLMSVGSVTMLYSVALPKRK